MLYYNDTSTLPRALDSLLRQTFTDWECIVVDDGSISSPGPVIEKKNDRRIKLVTNRTNLGRGASRQVGLEHSGGRYLCMLDADDRYRPEKLENQIRFMEKNPEVALASTGMTIADEAGKTVGYRMIGRIARGKDHAIFAPLRGPAFLKVAHAPSIIRMTVAKKYSYDATLEYSEDYDYLLRILMNHSFAVMKDFSYIYTETRSGRIEKIIRNFKAHETVLKKYRHSHPLRSRYYSFLSVFKPALYRMAITMGLGGILWKLKSRGQISKN